MRSVLPLIVLAVMVSGCPGEPTVDAGPPVDAGGQPTACAAPPDCRLAGVDGACRQGLCSAEVPCADDLECGLGERCLQGQCRFAGCASDADCGTGKCLLESYSCAECGSSADCPADRPVCEATSNTCRQCLDDAQCPLPGPPYCTTSGACVHCRANENCPTGLTCDNGRCTGAGPSKPCPQGIACAPDLACVQIGGNPICLPTCRLYQQQCAATEWCYRLTYSTSGSFVFEDNGPVGVCFASQAGLKGLNESCVVTPTGSTCQPNLMCVAETARVSLCRQFCNPQASGTCPQPQVCTSFPGDYDGHRYGLCLPDTGFGRACTGDAVCRSGLSCQPYEDPTDFNDVSPMCQFDVGTGEGLAPCSASVLSDGGVVPAGQSCRSGRCVADPRSTSSLAFYCYGACATDGDCAVGGRTGVCDGSYDVTLPSGTFGYVAGCRPGCTSTESCGEYDAGVVCRLGVTSGSAGRFSAVCMPPTTATRTAGDDCTSGGQCTSGLCRFDDSRGIQRRGLCTEACTAPAHCPADAGAVPTVCQPTVILGWRGPDGTAPTADDRLYLPSLCSGAPCTEDGDCTADGGAVCVPELDPAAPFTQVVSRCLRPTPSGAKRGGDACVVDAECVSGVCGALQSPSTGSGRACFEACAGSTVCPGTTVCRLGGFRLDLAAGVANLDSCAP